MERRSIVILAAVYLTGCLATFGAFAIQAAPKGHLREVFSLPLAKIIALYGIWGGSLALPFAILALRRTDIRFTIPIVAAVTVSAAWVTAYAFFLLSPAAALVAGLVAMLCVRSIRAVESN